MHIFTNIQCSSPWSKS